MKEASGSGGSNGDGKESHPEFSFFNVAELHEKLKVKFSNILLVTADEAGSRNKLLFLKNETREYTLMNISFADLLNHSPKLVMVNKFALLSLDAVHSWRYDFITLDNLFPGWDNKQVVLGRNYRKMFYLKIQS
jgi:hypothetical protein